MLIKSSTLHGSFIENISLVKIQKNCKSKKSYTQSLWSKVSHTIKMENFDHQNWSDCFV